LLALLPLQSMPARNCPFLARFCIDMGFGKARKVFSGADRPVLQSWTGVVPQIV